MRLLAFVLGCLVFPALAAEPVASTVPVVESPPIAMLPVNPAATWRTIASDTGRSIEVDTTSIQEYAPGKVLANIRLVLDKEIVDARSGGSYKYIMMQSRYDCEARSVATLKRSFVDAGKAILREENMPEAPDMPMRSGMLEERVMRELCRPLGSQLQRSKAQESAEALRQSKEALININRQLESATEALRKSNEAIINRQREIVRAAEGAATSAPRPVAASAPRRPTANVARKAEPTPPPVTPPLPVEWSYGGLGGPEHWGDIAKENHMCKEGRRQSPIDIRDGMEVDLEPVQFDYYPGLFAIADTGRGIEVRTNGDWVSLQGKDYYLERLTFKYPAEERINGRLFIMGVHLEHRAADGERLNIAVLLEHGAPNQVIQTFWDYLPLEKRQTATPDVEIDLNGLLPKEQGYHTYMGSMTRPPCEEGVIWVVLQTPVSVSVDQEAILARLYPLSARPIQPVEGRRIKSSRRAAAHP